MDRALDYFVDGIFVGREQAIHGFEITLEKIVWHHDQHKTEFMIKEVDKIRYDYYLLCNTDGNEIIMIVNFEENRITSEQVGITFWGKSEH
ncbi:MAG: hypothetical protein LC107_08235 [Chitinophagales bacterium]|nr:hypothetical protein [Chitinophagales bacterium]